MNKHLELRGYRKLIMDAVIWGGLVRNEVTVTTLKLSQKLCVLVVVVNSNVLKHSISRIRSADSGLITGATGYKSLITSTIEK